jgi:protein ImuB
MFACLYVPDFPVQASLLSVPTETRIALKLTPLALLDGPANLPRVCAVNSPARRAGIQAGMTKLQVETYGGILLRQRIVSLEDAAQNTLLEYGGKFSPRVESTCAGAVILDLTGTEKLFGPLKGMAREMVMNAAEIGFDLNLAIASNPDTAFHAACGFSGTTIIPVGEEARHLAALPVSVLSLSSEMLEVLDGWGIHTLRSLAALPTIAVTERLGQEGQSLQKLARGENVRPLLTAETIAEFTESFEFDDPVETLESLFFILNRLLQQLCSNLISQSLATNELRLTIGLKVKQIQNAPDNEEYKHEWKLPLPTQDRNILFGLVRLHLEKTTFSAPVQKLTIEVVPIKPRTAQGNLFAPPSPEPEKLEITLERIRGVVGAADLDGTACVGSPRVLDTHKPDSFTVQPFSSMGEIPNSFPAIASVVAFRLFRPAIETSVELNREKPQFVWLWERRRQVLAASGPWSSSGNWWNALVWKREEWDVALKVPPGIGFYRIYRDRIRRQWFVEGVFD